MARPPSAAIAQRNDLIYEKWRAGASLGELAKEYDRSPQQIGRVVASRHPELDDEDDRGLHRARLEDLFHEVRQMMADPGYKMAPNGRLAEDEDGRPILDVMTKLEAAKLQLSVLESMRKLDARDKVQPKQLNVQFDIAQQAMMRDIEERRKTIQGGVVRPELPPAD